MAGGDGNHDDLFAMYERLGLNDARSGRLTSGADRESS
jgi:hypothetical protein